MKATPLFTYFYIKSFCCFICCFFIHFYTQAQLCTGSLGDAVINTTFGTGAALPLSAATTNYSYITSDCPSDGSYTLRNNTVNCFGSWHTLSSDHTGNAQGNFMLVNASFEPSDFYVDTVKGLCSNTVYQFSAWVMNVGRMQSEIRPNITFSIEKTDGTILGSFSSGDVPATTSPQWNNYGLFFQTPSATFDVVLRMRNNAPGGAGNDIALDDITFRPCGPKISAQISGRGQAVDLCDVDTTSFILTSEVAAGYTNPLYQWQASTDGGFQWRDIAGATSLLYSRKTTAPGNYVYRLTVLKDEAGMGLLCRIASSTVAINVHAKPMVNAGPDRVLIKGEQVTLQGQVSGDSIKLVWSPQQFITNEGSLNPTIKPVQNITYVLSASSVWGCTNQDSVFIKVVDAIYIPTAFTPNGDGVNDVWRIPDLDPAFGAEVWVFNRLGEIVYHTKESTVAWNGMVKGKLQSSNVFVYLVNFKNGKPLLKGFITLIR